MYNWSVDEKRFKKENPKGYKLWRLTQLDRQDMEKFFLKLAKSLEKDIFK